MPKRVTREDVARLAGVSTAVVSYVINDGPRPVSASARERVLTAIESTGYTPNRAAQTLAHGHAQSIGLLIPNNTNPFLAWMTQTFGDLAFTSEYTLILGDSADDTAREAALVRHFLSQQLAGFIWYTVDQPAPIELLGAHPPRTIILNASEGLTPGPEVFLMTADEIAQGRIATQHLIERGCRRIGIIAGPSERLNTRMRMRGWEEALRAAGFDATRIVHADFTEEAGEWALPQLADCDGIVASNQRQGVGALAAAARTGIPVPDALKIVAINGTDAARYTIPTLTTVNQNLEFLAARTVELLRGESGVRNDVPLMLKARKSTEQ